MRRTVHHHASVVIVRSKSGNDFFFSGYDDGYPVVPFRNAVNLIGGNHIDSDRAPIDILYRELNEELTLRVDEEQKGFAPIEDIAQIRESILGYARPFADFIVTDPPVRHNRPVKDVIYSCYVSRVPDEVLVCARENIQKGNRLVSEGAVNVLTHNQILSGTPTLAWGTPPLLGAYLNEAVPNPWKVNAEHIGAPRETLAAYLADYEYTVPVALGQ